jgi:hypothetical protein
VIPAPRPSIPVAPPPQDRYFAVHRGMLSYFDSQEDWDKHRAPLKGIAITLKYYRVDP